MSFSSCFAFPGTSETPKILTLFLCTYSTLQTLRRMEKKKLHARAYHDDHYLTFFGFHCKVGSLPSLIINFPLA